MEQFKLVEIHLTKCLLIIPESAIFKYLPSCILEDGIRRGKYLKRCDRVQAYEKKVQELEEGGTGSIQ